jgi:hypothetical protein
LMARMRWSWLVVKSVIFVMGDGLMPGELRVNHGDGAFPVRCLEPFAVQLPALTFVVKRAALPDYCGQKQTAVEKRGSGQIVCDWRGLWRVWSRGAFASGPDSACMKRRVWCPRSLLSRPARKSPRLPCWRTRAGHLADFGHGGRLARA